MINRPPNPPRSIALRGPSFNNQNPGAQTHIKPLPNPIPAGNSLTLPGSAPNKNFGRGNTLPTAGISPMLAQVMGITPGEELPDPSDPKHPANLYHYNKTLGRAQTNPSGPGAAPKIAVSPPEGLPPGFDPLNRFQGQPNQEPPGNHGTTNYPLATASKVNLNSPRKGSDNIKLASVSIQRKEIDDDEPQDPGY